MANEKRLIDLDKAFGAINQEVWWTESEKAYFRSFLAKQPKVDAVEVVHGRWERIDKRYVEMFKCSICRSECYVPTCMGEPMYDYCPNCGANMMDGDGNA